MVLLPAAQPRGDDHDSRPEQGGPTFEFSPDGKLIAFSGDSRGQNLGWAASQKKLGDHKDVVGLAFTGDGKRVISLGVDNMVKEWEVASGSLVRSFELPLPSLTCVRDQS